MGCREIRFAADGSPAVRHHVIQHWDDVARLQVPADVAQHPAFRENAACLSILQREVGGRLPICAYVTATMTLPVLLMGMERWMELLLFGPGSVRDERLAKCHEFFVREIRAYRDGGANVIVYSNPFGSLDFVPREYLVSHSLPWIEKDAAAVGTEGIVYYCGMAALNPVIPSVLERTGIGAYYLSPADDVAEGARIIGGRALTCGVINDVALIGWSPAAVRTEVQRIIRAGMPCGRFLFGTGVMPRAIPEENIRTMLETAYECGALPAGTLSAAGRET